MNSGQNVTATSALAIRAVRVLYARRIHSPVNPTVVSPQMTAASRMPQAFWPNSAIVPAVR
jgi:hypothetical protein